MLESICLQNKLNILFTTLTYYYNMKSVRISIMQLSYFREVVKTPRITEINDSDTIIDIIYNLDKEYYNHINPQDRKNRPNDFLDERMDSLLQLLWDPESCKFYDDVAVEARTASPESKSIPIENDWKEIIPNEAWIVLTPNAGC